MIVAKKDLRSRWDDGEHVPFWDGCALKFGISLDEDRKFSDPFFELEIDGGNGRGGEGESEWDGRGSVVAGQGAQRYGDAEEADAGVKKLEGLLPCGEQAAKKKFGGGVGEDAGVGIFTKACEQLG